MQGEFLALSSNLCFCISRMKAVNIRSPLRNAIAHAPLAEGYDPAKQIVRKVRNALPSNLKENEPFDPRTAPLQSASCEKAGWCWLKFRRREFYEKPTRAAKRKALLLQSSRHAKTCSANSVVSRTALY